MTISVYLSDEVYDILSCYGPLDDVVDKILVAGSQGLIDIMDKPKAPEKKCGTYHKVNIKEQDYLTLLETYGVKSSHISLRRLLYWFVDNEVYLELGWEPSEAYNDSQNHKKYMVICELKAALFKAKRYIPEYSDAIDSFRTFINELEEEIWNV